MTDSLLGTRNFQPVEYENCSTGNRVPDAYRANAQLVLEQLQTIRDVLGVPVVITNGYRDPSENAHTPGSARNSQHMTAAAADFDVPGLTKRQVAELLDAAEDAGMLGDYHQLIYYLTDDHYHIGIGEGNERLVKVDNSYVAYTGADSLPDAHTPAGSGPWQLIAIVVIAVLLLGTLFVPSFDVSS